MNQYYKALVELGYKLHDHGNHWRTRAIFRNGKTSTSVIIYKDSGVWRDFGGDDEPKPFKVLVQETLKTGDEKIISQYVSGDAAEYRPPQKNQEDKIEMEKVYDESMLEKLLPITDFYEKRKVPAKIQKLFRCGYAGSGKMYRRMVFPIFNLNGQIHGFSGRAVSDDAEVKWKHTGRKANWIYPHHLSRKYIEELEEVILVESIGDCLALYSMGFYNVLVTFGLDLSPALLNYLSSFSIKRIIIATNNDEGKETNSGRRAAVKAAAKLSAFFDLGQVYINPPLLNDFGVMLEEGSDFKKWHERGKQENFCLSSSYLRMSCLKLIDSDEKLKKNSYCKELKKIFKKLDGSKVVSKPN